MTVETLAVDEDYLSGLITKYLARDDSAPRHDYGHLSGDARAAILEAWRFPWVDAWHDAANAVQRYNAVTFVHAAADRQAGHEVEVVGSFGELYKPLVLAPLGDTHYSTLTLKLPKGEVHYYRMRIDRQWQLDPINPQRAEMDNGVLWSRFFTWGATRRIALERWEARLLARLCSQILPFQSQDGVNFFKRSYNDRDSYGRPAARPAHAWRLDESVGAVNFIDKLLAREEAHHLIDYQICLELIDQVLRQRNPVNEPWDLPLETYSQLYDQMAEGNVPGWNYGRYGNPRYFLQLLRRHTLTGAFSHPSHGGNAMALGWKYLEERYRDAAGATLFDWGRSMEPPLGRNPAYKG